MIVRNYLFHRVSDEKDRLWPPMTPALFESIIRAFVRKKNVVALEDLLSRPEVYRGHRGHLVTISFDDGYKDNIEYAAPILAKYKCPASFYIVTGCIDRNIPTWTYLVDRSLQLTRKKHIDIPFEYAPDSFRKIMIKDFERHKDRVPGLKPWLKSLPNKHREEVVDYLVKETDDVPVPEGKMMSWDNIRELKQQGFIIGSHSHTHPMLANLASDDDIRYELQTSAERIMKEAGHQAETISYPIGSFDNRVTRIASECGYKWGLAVKQRFFDYGKDDTMAIPRLELYEEPWLKVQMRRFGLISKLRAVWS